MKKKRHSIPAVVVSVVLVVVGSLVYYYKSLRFTRKIRRIK